MASNKITDVRTDPTFARALDAAKRVNAAQVQPNEDPNRPEGTLTLPNSVNQAGSKGTEPGIQEPVEKTVETLNDDILDNVTQPSLKETFKDGAQKAKEKASEILSSAKEALTGASIEKNLKKAGEELEQIPAKLDKKAGTGAQDTAIYSARKQVNDLTYAALEYMTHKDKDGKHVPRETGLFSRQLILNTPINLERVNAFLDRKHYQIKETDSFFKRNAKHIFNGNLKYKKEVLNHGQTLSEYAAKAGHMFFRGLGLIVAIPVGSLFTPQGQAVAESIGLAGAALARTVTLVATAIIAALPELAIAAGIGAAAFFAAPVVLPAVGITATAIGAKLLFSALVAQAIFDVYAVVRMNRQQKQINELRSGNTTVSSDAPEAPAAPGSFKAKLEQEVARRQSTVADAAAQADVKAAANAAAAQAKADVEFAEAQAKLDDAKAQVKAAANNATARVLAAVNAARQAELVAKKASPSAPATTLIIDSNGVVQPQAGALRKAFQQVPLLGRLI